MNKTFIGHYLLLLAGILLLGVLAPGHGAFSVRGQATTVERRLSDWASTFRLSVKRIDERPDQPTGEVVYLVKDVFTTVNGSWEPSNEVGSIPQWARDAYLSADFIEAGATNYLFAAVIGMDGQLVADQEMIFWSDGFAQLGNPGYQGYIRERTKQSSRWANLPLSGGSVYDPSQGGGPWCWTPNAAAEVVCGGGIPSGHAVSMFVVWEAALASGIIIPSDNTATPSPTPTPGATSNLAPTLEATSTPAEDSPSATPTASPSPTATVSQTGTPTAPGVSIVNRRLGDWYDPFHLSIESLEQRPDQPSGDTIHMVKDVFTTRDGVWQPSTEIGSINDWAVADYLRPLGAPDYFDDAGGAHHLFAAILGQDGQLIRNAEIRFWSDGFAQLGNPNYQGYVVRQTKEHSGWINIPLEPGSAYMPSRGERGPWCWAPAGPSEVVCGGGMPYKLHVSMFVVWQAVPRTQVGPVISKTFLPLVTR